MEERFSLVPHGPFHRVETPNQTATVALLQEQSGEIWGRPARGSGQPSVKAYPGSLSPRRGVEFTTEIDPQPNSAPNEVRWYWQWCDGVELRQVNGEDFACIRWTTFTNKQP